MRGIQAALIVADLPVERAEPGQDLHINLLQVPACALRPLVVLVLHHEVVAVERDGLLVGVDGLSAAACAAGPGRAAAGAGPGAPCSAGQAARASCSMAWNSRVSWRSPSCSCFSMIVARWRSAFCCT